MRKGAKILFISLAVFAGVIVLLTAGGYLIPAEIELETQRTLTASADELYPLLATQEGIEEWWTVAAEAAEDSGRPPMDVDPAGGPAEGPGAKIRFSTGGSTLEDWTILATEPGKEVRYEVDFQIFVVTRTISLDPLPGGGTEVTWHETGSIDNPLVRYMTLLGGKDQAISNFEHSLEALDRHAGQTSAGEG